MDEKHIKVLLVEDDAKDALAVRELMTQAGTNNVELVYATRLLPALNRLAQGDIDSVLLDLSLLEGQGIQTIGRLRAQAPEVPVIVLARLEDEEVAIQALQKGAQDYLLKSQLNSRMLRRVIHYSIERYRLLAELEEKARQLEARERRFRKVISKNADGILVVGRAGEIRFVNPAAMTLFGWRPEELIGETFGFPLVVGETTEIEIRRRNGEIRTAAMRVVEIEWEGESASLVSLREITAPTVHV